MFYDYPVFNQPEQFYPSQTDRIFNNYLYEDYSDYYGAEGRNIEPGQEEIDRLYKVV